MKDTNGRKILGPIDRWKFLWVAGGSFQFLAGVLFDVQALALLGGLIVSFAIMLVGFQEAVWHEEEENRRVPEPPIDGRSN